MECFESDGRPAFKSLQQKGLHQTKKQNQTKTISSKHLKHIVLITASTQNDQKHFVRRTWRWRNDSTRFDKTEVKCNYFMACSETEKAQNICLKFVCFICVRRAAANAYLWKHFVLLEFSPREDEWFRLLLKPSARSNVCQFRWIQLDFYASQLEHSLHEPSWYIREMPGLIWIEILQIFASLAPFKCGLWPRATW